MKLASGDRVLVTGASGFIGSAVTRQLLAREQEVVALVEPGADTANLEGLDVKQVVGDLRSRESVQGAVDRLPGRLPRRGALSLLGPRPGGLLRHQRRGDEERARCGG